METIATHMRGTDPEQEPQGDGEASKRQQEALIHRLDSLGQSLAKTRSEAISGRQSSGIEQEWLEDDEFYQGIDDANRGEYRTSWRSKPMAQSGQSTTTSKKEGETRSTVFPNITRPYVDAAAARIADMLLPTDDRSWALKPTPVPELMDLAERGAKAGMNPAEQAYGPGAQMPQAAPQAAPIQQSGMGQPPQPAGMPGGAQPAPGMQAEAQQLNPGQPNLAMKQLDFATQQAMATIEEAKKRAEKAEKRIEDWHVECQYHAQVRLVIEDAARCGTGVLKGPVPMKKTRFSYQNNAVVQVEEIKPGSKRIDFWNFFPDPSCGEDIHNGGYTWERDYITRKRLRELLGQPGYIDSQIMECLKEGAARATAQFKPAPDIISDVGQKDKYEIWYYYGTVERDDLQAAGCDCGDSEDPHFPAMVVMVNNRVIKATLSPLDTGEFPYDVMVWQRRDGHWSGIGVARQIRTPQRMVTAATRNLMDNAGIAAGPMLVFRQGVVYGANGKDKIAPRKIWYIQQNAEEMVDATKAIGQIKVDMMVNELLQIINLGLKMAEDVTGLPMLLQGQMGNKSPDTLGGMQMLNNNASAVLRRLARLFDDRVTEPHVRRYYVWLLTYGEDDEKGDYCIDARGSSALVERDLQNQAIMQMGAIVTNPVFGLDPKKWAAEYLKSQRLDVKRFEFDDQDWEKIVANLKKGPQDPRVQVAQIVEASKQRLAAIEAQAEQALEKMREDHESEEGQKDRELKIIIQHMQETGKQTISLNELKGGLTDTIIKTRTQRDLSAADRAHATVREAMKPPTEPAGRAKPGHSFEQ